MFEVANISGYHRTRGDELHIHVYGSGAFMQRPWRLNDWFRTNFLALIAVGVHLGYLIAAIRLLRHLRTQIRDSQKVRITGHSMGGATAEVAGVILSLYRKVQTVSTENYGGPAPWWFLTAWGAWLILWARGLNSKWYLAGSDPVPLIPPWNVHIGHRVTLPSVGDPIRNHMHGYDRYP